MRDVRLSDLPSLPAEFVANSEADLKDFDVDLAADSTRHANRTRTLAAYAGLAPVTRQSGTGICGEHHLTGDQLAERARAPKAT
jgi:hypothetical protein